MKFQRNEDEKIGNKFIENKIRYLVHERKIQSKFQILIIPINP